MMKLTRSLIILIFMPLTTPAATYHLTTGDQLAFPASAQRIWIENGKILKAEASGSKILLKGLREGSSQIKLNNSYDTVHVLSPNKISLYNKFTKLFQQILGLEISIIEDQIILSGHLERWNEWQLLQKIAQDSHSNYLLEVTLSEDLKEKMALELNKILKNEGLNEQNFLFGKKIEVRLPQKEVRISRYQKILGEFGVQVTSDEDSIEQTPTVKVQITIAEISRSLSQQLGIKWPGSYEAKIIKNTVAGTEPFNLSAQFLEQSGGGRILASPNLICKSGKEAEFLAGGEFPIRIINFKTQDVVWKRYGILLNVKPKADLSGRMSITIQTEVSTIDTSRTVDGIPGLLTNKVSSTFDLNKPQIIALSGLLKKEDGESREGLPFLSRIPILGNLFSSQDYKDNRTELIIFVRPEILKSDSPQSTNPEHLTNNLGTIHE